MLKFVTFLVVACLTLVLVSGCDSGPKTDRERIEDCLSAWDGNHAGFEDQVRRGLNDEGSMQTHGTYFTATPNNLRRVPIRMEYSAKNLLGGRIKSQATGYLDATTCKVTVESYGY